MRSQLDDIEVSQAANTWNSDLFFLFFALVKPDCFRNVRTLDTYGSNASKPYFLLLVSPYHLSLSRSRSTSSF